MSVRWDGPAATALVLAEFTRRLKACAILVSTTARKDLSVPGTTTVVVGKTKAGKTRTKRRYNTNPSKPGEPPHKQTGRLRASVAWELVGLTARVGTNVKYGRILELFRDRAWLRPALQKCRARIEQILSGK